jgi:hypothetical protein
MWQAAGTLCLKAPWQLRVSPPYAIDTWLCVDINMEAITLIWILNKIIEMRSVHELEHSAQGNLDVMLLQASSACWFLARFILRPRRWSRQLPLKRSWLLMDYTALYLRRQNTLKFSEIPQYQVAWIYVLWFPSHFVCAGSEWGEFNRRSAVFGMRLRRKIRLPSLRFVI